jgi:hypothetical protein
MKFLDWYVKIGVASALVGASMEFFMVKTGFCVRNFLTYSLNTLFIFAFSCIFDFMFSLILPLKYYNRNFHFKLLFDMAWIVGLHSSRKVVLVSGYSTTILSKIYCYNYYKIHHYCRIAASFSYTVPRLRVLCSITVFQSKMSFRENEFFVISPSSFNFSPSANMITIKFFHGQWWPRP